MAYAAVCKYINCAVDTLLALALVANYITSYSVIIINNNNNNNNNYYYYYYHYYYYSNNNNNNIMMPIISYAASL